MQPNIKPKNIKKNIQRVYNVEIPYGRAWAAKEDVLKLIHGTHEDSYAKLPKYCEQLAIANPSTFLDLESTERTNQFCCLFLCYNASATGFAACKRLLGIDGTIWNRSSKRFFSWPPERTRKVNCSYLHSRSLILRIKITGCGSLQRYAKSLNNTSQFPSTNPMLSLSSPTVKRASLTEFLTFSLSLPMGTASSILKKTSKRPSKTKTSRHFCGKLQHLRPPPNLPRIWRTSAISATQPTNGFWIIRTQLIELIASSQDVDMGIIPPTLLRLLTHGFWTHENSRYSLCLRQFEIN